MRIREFVVTALGILPDERCRRRSLIKGSQVNAGLQAMHTATSGPPGGSGPSEPTSGSVQSNMHCPGRRGCRGLPCRTANPGRLHQDYVASWEAACIISMARRFCEIVSKLQRKNARMNLSLNEKAGINPVNSYVRPVRAGSRQGGQAQPEPSSPISLSGAADPRVPDRAERLPPRPDAPPQHSANARVGSWRRRAAYASAAPGAPW